MDQDMFRVRDGVRRSGRSRPLSRMQEIAVLAVVFAIGVALQAALLLDIAPLTQ